MLLWSVHFDNTKREYGPSNPNPGGSQYILDEITKMRWMRPSERVLQKIKENAQKMLTDTHFGFSLDYLMAPTKEKAIEKALEWVNHHTEVGPVDVCFPDYDDYGNPLPTKEDYLKKHQKKLKRKQNKAKQMNDVHIPVLPENRTVSMDTTTYYTVMAYQFDAYNDQWEPIEWKTFTTQTDAEAVIADMLRDYQILFTALKENGSELGIPEVYYKRREQPYKDMLNALGKSIFKQFNHRYGDILELTNIADYGALSGDELINTFYIRENKLFKYC